MTGSTESIWYLPVVPNTKCVEVGSPNRMLLLRYSALFWGADILTLPKRTVTGSLAQRYVAIEA